MRNLLTRWPVAVALLMTMMLPGCGGGASGRPALAPVAGEVKYKGAPLESGQIMFFPEKGRTATGDIVKGKIVNVMTYDPNDGVPVGKHKVTISAFDKPATDMYAKRNLIVPKKYTEAATTDLTADVTSKGRSDLKFDLVD